MRKWLGQPGSAFRLGFCRLFFYGWFLLQLFYYQPTQFAGLPESWWFPVYLLAPWGPPSPELFFACTGFLFVSLVAACLGIATRLSCFLVAMAGTLVMGWTNCYGGAEFHLTPLILTSWILPFSACGDAFSWDSRWRAQGPPAHARYGWPIRLAWLTLILPMVSAGLFKVLGTWLWQPGQTMTSFVQFKFLVHAHLKGNLPWPALARLVDFPWLLAMMAWVTLLFECGCPLALLSRPSWLRPFFVGGLFSMQLLLALGFLTLETFPWLAVYCFWVPWERILTLRKAGNGEVS